MIYSRNVIQIQQPNSHATLLATAKAVVYCLVRRLVEVEGACSCGFSKGILDESNGFARSSNPFGVGSLFNSFLRDL